MGKFSLDMVFVQPHAQPSQPQHGRKKSVSYSFKCQHHHPFLDNVLVDAFMYIVLSLSTIEIHNLYTSLYLLCTYNAGKELVVKMYSLTT